MVLDKQRTGREKEERMGGRGGVNLEKKFGEGREAEGRLQGGGSWGEGEHLGARRRGEKQLAQSLLPWRLWPDMNCEQEFLVKNHK